MAKLTRRKIVKSAIGGTAAAAVVLPVKWSKPVLNTVLTPAHAQTSSPVIVAGVYVSSNPLALNLKKLKNTEFAILDLLIAPTQANSFPEEVCPDVSDTSDQDDGNSALYIRVNEDMTVDFAIDSLLDFDDSRDSCGSFGEVSVVDETIIPDTLIEFADRDGVQLVDMELSAAGEISGQYFVFESNEPVCSGPFTVELGGSFPNAATCFVE